MTKLGPPDEAPPASTMEEWLPAQSDAMGSMDYNVARGQRADEPAPEPQQSAEDDE